MTEWEETKNGDDLVVRLGGFDDVLRGQGDGASSRANILPFLGGLADFGTSLIGARCRVRWYHRRRGSLVGR